MLFWVWSLAEVVDLTIGSKATDDNGTGRGLDGTALGTDRDFAVVAYAPSGLLTKDVRPPRAFRGGTEHGTFFLAGLVPSGFGRCANFAMDFMTVGMDKELVEQDIGVFQFDDFFGGEYRRQAILKVMVAAFHFAFGLGSGGKAQGHAVEVESGPKLSESLRGVGKKERVVVDIKGQRQTVSAEGLLQEIEVSQQCFGVIEASGHIKAGGIVQEVEQSVLVGLSEQPVMRGGVVLPKSAQLLGLPAFDRLQSFLIAGVGSESVLNRPAADTGAVGFELETPMQFTGRSAVGARGFRGEQLFEQLCDFGGPIGMMIPT